MIEREELFRVLNTLFDDVQNENFSVSMPMLAHYTTINTLESILLHNELWLSNPLYMNDFEEVRFGINEGTHMLSINEEIATACGSQERADKFKNGLELCFNEFEQAHVLNTHVFCLSEHDPADNNGLLSMWRGYGGNGKGVALIFDTSKLEVQPGSPLVLAKVRYAPTELRLEWINTKIKEVINIINSYPISDDDLYWISYFYFERIKYFSLFTKHEGFSEEREWRVVYMPDRDKSKALDAMLGYFIGVRGVEPKLKLKIQHIEGVMGNDISLEKLIDRIILGPSVSSPLAFRAIQKMLEKLSRPGLKEKLRASRIPFRET